MKPLPDIRAQLDTIELIKKTLLATQSTLSSVRGLGGQRGYSIQIGETRLTVATTDPHTYNGTLIRGMEMMHLGALKALGAQIDALKTQLAAAEAKLKEMVQ